MVLYHASKEIVTSPEVRVTKYTKDFGWGFYCTIDYDQACRWAKRGTGQGIINSYEYNPDQALSILKYEQMTDEWLDFIAFCRSGKMHDYDIVEGPMANDEIWNYVNDYIRGTISKKQFWALAEFRHPTHQISFHTEAALKCLSFVKSEEIYD